MLTSRRNVVSRICTATAMAILASSRTHELLEVGAFPRHRSTAQGESTPFEMDLADLMPKGSSGSLVAALDGEMATCLGWGTANRESGVAATCDTVCDIMSMTKQFTATAVLKLQMQGKLRVADQLGEHLGAVPSDKGPITIQQLLTHTSGLVDTLGDDDEPLSRDGMLTAALDSELQSPPGDTWLYSNVGYSLLAAIIEEAAGMPYEEYLHTHLFLPAGMTQTGYVIPTWQDADIAIEYDAEGRPQGHPFDHPWADDGPYWNLRGNGGILSTARDMYRWYLALSGSTVLDARSKAELFEPRVREEPDGDTFYAYGWVVADTDHGRMLWHNGGNAWSYGEILLIPEAGAMIFWITNQSRSDPGGWDLEESGSSITERIIERVLASGS